MDLNSLKGMISVIPPWMLLGVGFISGWLRSFWSFFYGHTIGWAEKKIKVSLTIEEHDFKEAFLWLNMWMEKNLRKKKVSSLRLEKRTWDSKEFDLIPGYGSYYFWWNRKLVTFYSSKKEVGGAGEGGDSGGALMRTVDISIWGTRDRQKILDVLTEAKLDYDKSHPTKLKYYIHRDNRGAYWDDYTMQKRDLDTLYLPDAQIADIVSDFEKFFEAEKEYRSLGIPWRKGYLLEGPPGSGKSTIAQVLACHLSIRIYYINLNTVNGSGLMELMGNVISPCIILMEDVDCVKAAKERQEDEKESTGIKTNELLNILDGLVATEQRIVIMTTNHPDRLDKALVRPGRVDRVFHIGYAKDEELNKFHSKAEKVFQLPDFTGFRRLLPDQCTIADAQAKVFEIQAQKDLKNLTLSE